jgi:1-acyl-sn-glycerol-3-phosphate acyltransferase
MVLGPALDRPLHYLARKTLFDTPVFGWLIRQVNAFPLNRGGDSREALRAFGELLSRGEAVVLFPEGTRSKDGSRGEIKAGVGMLAVRNQAKVLPGYLWGTYQSWPRGRMFPKRHHIKAFFGDPVMPLLAGESRKDARSRVTGEVESAFKRLEAEAWAGEPNPPPGVVPREA